MWHVSIRDFKKQKIENSMLNRDSTQNLSALKISNVQYSMDFLIDGQISSFCPDQSEAEG